MFAKKSILAKTVIIYPLCMLVFTVTDLNVELLVYHPGSTKAGKYRQIHVPAALPYGFPPNNNPDPSFQFQAVLSTFFGTDRVRLSVPPSVSSDSARSLLIHPLMTPARLECSECP